METNTPLDQPEIIGQDTDPRSNLATQGKRFTNLIIDAVAFYGFSFCVGMVIAFSGFGRSLVRDELALNLFSIALYVFYYFVSEAAFGRTLGKVVTRTKVVDEKGNKPSANQLLGRTLCRVIPFEAFSFLGSDVGWHDRFSGTYVINDK
jgi:uncharacterized RDD family membrane protein YckC